MRHFDCVDSSLLCSLFVCFVFERVLHLNLQSAGSELYTGCCLSIRDLNASTVTLFLHQGHTYSTKAKPHTSAVLYRSYNPTKKSV